MEENVPCPHPHAPHYLLCRQGRVAIGEGCKGEVRGHNGYQKESEGEVKGRYQEVRQTSVPVCVMGGKGHQSGGQETIEECPGREREEIGIRRDGTIELEWGEKGGWYWSEEVGMGRERRVELE